MTNLKCSVENCLHNCNNLCELGEIAVKGHHAQQPDTTCCSTFCDTTSSLQNETVARADVQTQIQCSAKNCVYNGDCHCHADGIEVCGCGANHAEHTVCSTFSCK